MLKKYVKHAYKLIRFLSLTFIIFLTSCSSKPRSGIAPIARSSISKTNAASSVSGKLKSIFREKIKKMIQSAQAKGYTLLASILIDISENEKKNRDINQKDPSRSNETALHQAVALGDPEITESLIEHGADVNAENKDKCTPIHLGVRMGRIKVLATLINNKHVNINKQDLSGYTPLHLATQEGNAILVNLLLSHEEIDVNVQGPLGNTALHLAAKIGNIPIIRALLKKGAKADIQDQGGQTPSDQAHDFTTKQVIEEEKQA